MMEIYRKLPTMIHRDPQLWDLKQDSCRSSYPDFKWQIRERWLMWNIGSNKITLGIKVYRCRPWYLLTTGLNLWRHPTSSSRQNLPEIMEFGANKMNTHRYRECMMLREIEHQINVFKIRNTQPLIFQRHMIKKMSFVSR